MSYKFSRAIIDKGVRLPERTVIGYDLEEDRKRYHVTDSGIVVVVAEDMQREHSRGTSLAPAASGSLTF
jgi:ADP-glucose pyrophosphorylase